MKLVNTLTYACVSTVVAATATTKATPISNQAQGIRGSGGDGNGSGRDLGILPGFGGRLLVCGNPNEATIGENNLCFDDEGNFVELIDEWDLEAIHEIRCCAAPPSKGVLLEKQCGGACGDLFGYSYIPNADSEGEECHAGTYQDAKDYCDSFGARLCTVEELRDGCTAGSGCGHDNHYIWAEGALNLRFVDYIIIDSFYVVCGNPDEEKIGDNNECFDNEGNFVQQFTAQGDEQHEIRCCSDDPLDWYQAHQNREYGCDGTVGGSRIPKIGTTSTDELDADCLIGTYAEATDFCASGGARLCTRQELLDSCTRGTGCGFDNHYVWSSTEEIPPPTPIETSDPYWLACGNSNFEEINEEENTCFDEAGNFIQALPGVGTEEHEIRCCSDTALDWELAQTGRFDCPEGVYGGSKIPEFFLFGEAQCLTGTYGTAEAYCEAAGARLCSLEEVLEGCTRGSGCGFDNHLVWTKTAYTAPVYTETEDKHWLVCGNPFRDDATGCMDENGDFHVTYQGNGLEEHEVRCCSDEPLPWIRARNNPDTCPGIYGGSIVPLNGNPDYGACVHKATYAQAEAICTMNNARLCTQIELANQCTRGTGCSHDIDWIWSSTPVEPEVEIQPSTGFHQVACGNPAKISSPGCQDASGKFFPTFRAGDEQVHEVRCCSDTKLPWFDGTASRKNDGCKNWGISELPIIANSNGPKECYHAASHWEAELICSLNGARLCTDLEIFKGCTKGSGCGHDKDWVWTYTPSCEDDEDCYNKSHADKYVGCFEDDPDIRELPLRLGKYYSADKCYQACSNGGYSYFGLKKGHVCFCGDDTTKTPEVAASECSMPCSLGPGEQCGGSSAIAMFGTGKTAIPGDNYERDYLGCFDDVDGVLSTDLGTGFSLKECVEACTDGRKAVASLTNGDQCLCGDQNLAAKSTECLQPCANGKGVCGQPDATAHSVYKNLNGLKPLQNLLECKGARARWWGDPHFITFDNLAYNCQGFGTFIVAECDDYMIQGLFKPRGVSGSKATVTDGIAAKYKEYPVVQVNFAMFESELTSYVEGKPVHIFVGGQLLNQTAVPIHDEIDITVRGIYIEIQFPDHGPAIRIKIRSPNVGVMDVEICVPSDCMSSTTGILGSPDGDKKNDIVKRDGQYVFPYPNDLNRRGGYYHCRDEWCVETEEASLFTYGEEYGSTKVFDDFYGCDRPYPGDINIDDLDPDVAGQCAALPTKAAREACKEELAEADDDDEDIIDDILDENDNDDTDDDDDPEDDEEPECPADIVLIQQTGRAFSRWPLKITDQNTTHVKVQLKTPLRSDTGLSFYHMEYTKVHGLDDTCEAYSDLDGSFREEITVHCLASRPVAYVHLYAADTNSYALPGDNATIPECCHPDDLSIGIPTVHYTFSISCETKCPEVAAAT